MGRSRRENRANYQNDMTRPDESPTKTLERFAFVHRAIINADGLFRRLKSEVDYHGVTDIKWYCTDNICHRFYGPTLLGETDSVVLIALMSKAGGLYRRDELRQEHARLRAAQRDPFVWLNQSASISLDLTVSLRDLAELSGLGTGGASLGAVRRSLERLSAVKFWMGSEIDTFERDQVGQPLITIATSATGEFCIRLAPVLWDAMLGQRANHTMVRLREILDLPARGYSRMLALRLCWINQGEFRSVRLSSLARYIWCDREPTPVERTRLRAAMAELQLGNWSVQCKNRGSDSLYVIGRAALVTPSTRRIRRKAGGAEAVKECAKVENPPALELK